MKGSGCMTLTITNSAKTNFLAAIARKYFQMRGGRELLEKKIDALKQKCEG